MNRFSQLLSNFRFLPGPIIAVEMVTTARRKSYYVLRVIYVLLLLITVVSCQPNYLYNSEMSTLAAVAASMQRLFVTFGYLQILAVTFVGPAMAAGTIASERERRTIEYLFASTLNDAEIILGKLSARLLSILYLILAGIPVLSAAMLLGGISPQSLLLLFVITFSTAVFVAVVSVCISAFSKRSRDAVVSTYLVMIVFMAVVWLLSVTIRQHIPGFSEAIDFLMDTHPLATFNKLLEYRDPTAGAAVRGAVYQMVRNQAMIAGTLLIFATLFMRRAHLRQTGAGVKKRRWRFRLFSGSLRDQPMLWKELWAEPAARIGLVGFIALAMIYATVLGFTFYLTYWALMSNPASNARWYSNQYVIPAVFLATAVACGTLLIIAARSASAVTSEKERDCWDSLISTPLAAQEIVFAKMLGSIWAVRGVMPLILITWLPAILTSPVCIIALAFHLGTLAIVAMFAAALGVHWSLGSKNSMRAMAATVAISIFVGGGYLFCCMTCCLPVLRDGSQIIFAGFVPFLLVFPAICTFGVPSSNEFSTAVAAYLIGNVAYGIAAAILYATAVERFDRLSGRTHPRHFHARPMVEIVSVQQANASSPTPPSNN